MLISINEIMQYKNTALFRRYEKDFPDNKLSADESFYHLVQFFWLCEKHRIDINNNPNDDSLKFICSMYHEMAEIDDMWHTFLMFTEEYENFCKRYFGRFIHHAPKDDNEKINPDIVALELTQFLSYVYDNLGEKTVSVWFAELIDKHTG